MPSTQRGRRNERLTPRTYFLVGYYTCSHLVVCEFMKKKEYEINYYVTGELMWPPRLVPCILVNETKTVYMNAKELRKLKKELKLK